MSEQKLIKAKSKRSVLVGQINRVKTFTETKLKTATVAEIEGRLDSLKGYFESFDAIQSVIEQLDSDEFQNEDRATFEELYFELKPLLIVALNNLMHSESGNHDTSVKIGTDVPTTNFMLPKQPLPMFSGNYIQWTSFYETFKNLVHKNSALDNVTRFHYLRSALTDGALKQIESLEISSANYDVALQLLIDRYDKKPVIIQEHIRKLFELKPISKPTSNNIRELIDTVNAHTRALTTLGRPVAHWDDLLNHLILSKLDFQTLEKWNDDCAQQRLASLVELLRFLEKRCRILEGNPNAYKQTTARTSRYPTQPASFTATVASSTDCLFCKKGSHAIHKCSHFLSLPTNERITAAKQHGLCTNCLRSGHMNRNCSSKGTCRTCRKRHHTLLHLVTAVEPMPSAEIVEQPTQSCPTTSFAATSTALTSNASNLPATIKPKQSTVLLATALGRVLNSSGQFVACRILLDSGSQLNFISEEFACLLGLKRSLSYMPIGGIGEIDTLSKYKMTISLHSNINSFHTEVEVQSLPRISQNIPETFFDIQGWPIPPGIQLADPNFNFSSKIDILLGAQLYCKLLYQGLIQLTPNLPSLQNTVFGWVVMGEALNTNSTRHICNIATTTKPTLTAIESILTKFWEIDSHDTPIRTLSNEERICELHFSDNFRRDESGRFVVRLPFKHDPITNLGSSLEMSKRRLSSIEKKLSKHEEVNEQYHQFMDEYKQLGHMSEVTCIPKNNYFLPHHFVLKPDSSTTKLRVVFDGSAKTSSGKSLNDVLLTGPTIQADLFSIIIQFRVLRYVFTADISKMYRQILVDPRDRRYQMISWRNSADTNHSYYQLNTVTYGLSSAPYLATRCLQQLARESAKSFPQASSILERSTYVDDIMTGANDLNTAITLQSEIITVLSAAKFELRKFCANHPRLLESIPLEDRETFLSINENEFVKTLGLIWQPASDSFHYNFQIPEHSTITKRTVVSDLGKIFDPLGTLGPVIILGKIFVQQLWKMKELSWDDPLPPPLSMKWKNYIEGMAELKSFDIPRLVSTCSPNETVELHAFSDSSEVAYGACCYIRTIDEQGNITTRLLCGKSRVAPLKSISIPKLELCAALLMAELVDRVKEILQINFTKIIYYTDSQIVLQWLQCPSYNWTTFVANRVTKIKDLTADGVWKHVSTKSNPADIISRGSLPLDLRDSTLWFNGPDFLHMPLNDVVNQGDTIPMESMPEQRTVKMVLLVSHHRDLLDGVRHNHSLLKLERIFAYVYRFIQNCRTPTGRNKGPLQPKELQKALTGLLRNVQRIAFSEFFEGCTGEKSHLKSLSPFLDENDNLIRVGGRIQNSNQPYNTKHQILIPKNHVLTHILFVYFHGKNMHAGPQALLASIRQMYWPLSGRLLARKTVNNCIRCFRCKPRGIQHLMGNLPSERVQPGRPFQTTGVDFCGPFRIYIRVRGKTPVKAYVCVFICFATKAVHMELVGDLSTEAFIAALRRFMSRRGLCSTIFCDNATNFIGARNELSALADLFMSESHQCSINELCLKEKIEWRPIPPRSPHFGGLWEAAVKVAKYHLVRVVADASLTYEELATIVIQVEGILNSRPLTPLSSDPNDLEALTPGHFLIGQPISSFPEPNISSKRFSSLSRFRRLQFMQQIFWQRWSTEYLHLLQHRYKWNRSQQNLAIGTLVIIKEDNLPPLKWLLGRITKTFPGKDGVVRVAEVKTTIGLYKRAVANLFPLPIENEHPEDVHGGRDV